MLVLSSSTDTADTDQLPQSEASFSGPDTSPGHWELERKLAGSEEVEYENWTGDIKLSVGGWGLTVPSLVVMACSQACILPSYVGARGRWGNIGKFFFIDKTNPQNIRIVRK